jgi:hypothetical protein
MLRDVLIASMNKGQFPLAVVALVIIVMIVKMSSESVTALVYRLIGDLENGSLFGYILALVMAGGWFVHSRWQRKVLTNEIDRLALERDKWQAKQMKLPLGSSKR